MTIPAWWDWISSLNICRKTANLCSGRLWARRSDVGEQSCFCNWGLSGDVRINYGRLSMCCHTADKGRKKGKMHWEKRGRSAGIYWSLYRDWSPLVGKMRSPWSWTSNPLMVYEPCNPPCFTRLWNAASQHPRTKIRQSWEAQATHHPHYSTEGWRCHWRGRGYMRPVPSAGGLSFWRGWKTDRRVHILHYRTNSGLRVRRRYLTDWIEKLADDSFEVNVDIKKSLDVIYFRQFVLLPTQTK